MSDNSQIKQHISIDERMRWDKVVDDFTNHLGAGGVYNHPLGNGATAGFSTNDYSNAEKTKLSGVAVGANNYTHPTTHPYTMITGLHNVAHTGNYSDLINIPTTFIAGGGNADTVGGIRITIGATSPASPTNNKDIWFDTTNKLVKVYTGGSWQAFNAVYA